MYVAYRGSPANPIYCCRRDDPVVGNCRGQNLAANVVDDLVARQVLQVLEPASVELALQAEEKIQREQERLEKHWQQELERARYKTERARRQYDVVEPENRLVARELERHWEQARLAQHKVQEEYERFQQTQLARQLNAEGFHSPQRGHPFNVGIVRSMLSRNRLTTRPRRDAAADAALHKENEWWLEELASELEMACPTLQGWCRKGWVHARKVTVAYRRFVIWADNHELDRLRWLRDYQRPSLRVPYPRELTTPRARADL
jgi:hypothetical protein